ncbi:MAG: ABC transporter permease subunit/CPBP intramembrane protease [Myxococcota bacterium]
MLGLRWRVVAALLAKEGREVLRDRRTLLLTLVVPAVVYPLLIASMGQMTAAAVASLRARPVTVAVSTNLPPDVLDGLKDADNVTVRESESPEKDVREGEVRAGLEPMPPPPGTSGDGVRMFMDAANDESRAAADRVEQALDKVREQRLQGRLARLGVDEAYLQPLPVEKRNTSAPERMKTYAAARMLPFLLIVLSLVGATAAAVDTTAGERERGTLLTLMTAPVRAGEVAAAKLVTVAGVALAAGLANMLSLGFTLASSMATSMQFSLALSPRLIAGCLLALVPTTLYGAALLLGLAALGRTSREAQTATAPALFIGLGLAAVVAIPGVQAQPMFNALPVAGPALLMRDLLMGDATLPQALTVIVSSLVTLWLLVSFAARVLMSEPMVSSQVSTAAVIRDLSGGTRPTTLSAAILAATLLASTVYVAPWMQRKDLIWGLVGTQLCLAGLGAGLLLALRLDVKSLLGLRLLPPWRAVASAALFGLSLGVPLAMAEAWLVKVSGLEEALKGLEEAFRELFETRLDTVTAVLVLGVMPGIFEELAFRGALQGVLLKVTRARRAVVLQAVIFALAHQSAIRFPPTFVLGIILGLLRLRSGSVVPGMILHTLHNGLVAVVLTATGASATLDEDAVRTLLGDPRLVVGIVVSLLMGTWLLYRTRPRVSDDGRT